MNPDTRMSHTVIAVWRLCCPPRCWLAVELQPYDSLLTRHRYYSLVSRSTRVLRAHLVEDGTASFRVRPVFRDGDIIKPYALLERHLRLL